jgi:diguanylate cyclase (GGDEF)-like protein
VTALILLGAEALVVLALVLFLFRLRPTFGLAPLYVCLGVFQVLQTMTSAVFVEVGPGLLVSPGSAILFTMSLCVVLMVYIREDALETRKLIYALVISNAATGFLSMATAYQLRAGSALSLFDLPPEAFASAAGMLVLGSALLLADALLIPVIYELVVRRVGGLFRAMYLTMALVLIFDSLLFVSTFFLWDPNYGTVLLSAIAGKVCFSAMFCAGMAAYLRTFEREGLSTGVGPAAWDLFAVLTYRQRYERLAAEAARDGLTGVFNRAHFETVLREEWARSVDGRTPLSLILADVDAFKAFNDRYGHPAGDQCLRAVAQALSANLRPLDMTARYGGEEFVVLLPNTDATGARAVADALCEAVAALGLVHEVHPLGRVTISLGVATFDTDGPVDAPALVSAADTALYRAKAHGRNRVEVA